MRSGADSLKGQETQAGAIGCGIFVQALAGTLLQRQATGSKMRSR